MYLVLAAIAVLAGWTCEPALVRAASADKAREAMAVCDSVDALPVGDREQKLERLDEGIALGEAAVAADAGDAQAHFSLFCNLAKQVEVAGLSWRALARVRRMRAVLDQAYALAPDDADILVARGEFLRRLPSLLGGDKAVGTALLRRAVELYPDHVPARIYVARMMADEGSPEARREAYKALALAQKAGTLHDQSEAQEVVASLGD